LHPVSTGTSLAAMESHEWNENTVEGKRYYRANFQGGRWGFLTTLQKRDPAWDRMENPGREVWQELRDIVWKKYQRKRCPWERVAEIDRVLAEFSQKP
jgi:hypothetical protein